ADVRACRFVYGNPSPSDSTKNWTKKLHGKCTCDTTLRDGNARVTLLMTAQINTDFANHPVPSATEPSTSLVCVGTDACESIINSYIRYKDYDFHKNAWPR
ncbi:uncharacterized protein TNCV_1254901, partial [Trichonephila clavipes]